MTTRHCRITTDLGELTLVADGAELVGVYFPHHWTRPSETGWGATTDAASDPVLSRARDELADYLAGRRTSFEVPMRADGDEFQRRVWALLEEIPYGATTTYGALAEQLGDKALARQVGQAVGHNPLSILIPCHRVVGTDGTLTGYAGGLRRKQHLLALEEPPEIREARLF